MFVLNVIKLMQRLMRYRCNRKKTNKTNLATMLKAILSSLRWTVIILRPDDVFRALSADPRQRFVHGDAPPLVL